MARRPDLLRHPLLPALLGSLLIAWSGVFVLLADVPAATSAFFRCLWALPALAAWAWHVRRRGREQPASRRGLQLAVAAGVFFGIDLVAWHVSIGAIGAGLSTVLANSQVAIVPLSAWLLLGERPARRRLASVPVVLAGIVLISGIASSDPYGDAPLLGALAGVATAFAYSGFLLCMRAGTGSGAIGNGHSLVVATAVAGVVAGAAGLVTGTLVWPSSPSAHGWLVALALLCQVLAWLLIGSSLSRLPAAVVSLLLPVQPVGALLLGVLVLSEAPSALQWAGAALVLAGIVVAASAPTPVPAGGRTPPDG